MILERFIVLSLCVFIGINATTYLALSFPPSVVQETNMNIVQILQKYKYPVEVHHVKTEDNYILTMHRIPRPKAKPVFLMHGLLDSSITWIVMGPWSGLGYYLYDNGYDVWMGNARGNRYSRNHTTLNPDENADFWSFSWHEIGIYDLPAMIDYVLDKTGYKNLIYFGHSQGTTSFWVMASMRPEYNKKIVLMNALAPVAFMKHLKSPLRPLVIQMIKSFGHSIHEFMPHSHLGLEFCYSLQPMLQVCLNYLGQAMGNDNENLNKTQLPVVFANVPAGCNVMQVKHYLQLTESDRFCQYDYGRAKNMKVYNQSTPPDYPLEKISAPVGLYYTHNDFLSSEVDVQRLAKLLPNVVENCLYPYSKWSHVSMIWGNTARNLAHKPILKLMKKYDNMYN